jgi:hypothetical protein
MTIFKFKKEEGKQKEGSKHHRRDGLPAENYDGVGLVHIFPRQHVRWSLTPGLPRRDREIYLILIRRQKGREVRKIKHTYIINEHI